MRFILICSFLILGACAKASPGQDPEITTLEAARIICAPRSIDLQMVLFPDGILHKTEVAGCSHGCTEYRDVNNPSLTLTLCGAN